VKEKDKKSQKPTVVVAGASGFVGYHLLDYLLSKRLYNIKALSRNFEEDRYRILDSRELAFSSQESLLKWKQCDLFSLWDCEQALKGADYAIYLIHSMLPVSKLVQANFADRDVIIADNFARAAKKCNIKHIIYLGGSCPDKDKKFSAHLKSRLEVEETLKSYGTPVTTLHSAMIFGPGSSSYNIIKKLIERLPILICPSWVNSRSNPVALSDVLLAIDNCLKIKNFENKCFDLCQSESITYLDLMKKVAKYKKKKCVFILVPAKVYFISKSIISFITNISTSLVFPLIESLKYDLIAKEENILKIPKHKFKNIDQCVAEAEDTKNILYKNKSNISFINKPFLRADVQSVQRLQKPSGRDAFWLAKLYIKWLPKFFSFIIRVRVSGNECKFIGPFFKTPMLVLSLSDERSTSDRQLFYITGGYLAKSPLGRARLEFREAASGKYCFVAIHEYIPSLPWYVYKYTQALVHLYVMRQFQKFIKSKKAS
jgi:uncharacterized protein YbjT (DUF2867 family)